MHIIVSTVGNSPECNEPVSRQRPRNEAASDS